MVVTFQKFNRAVAKYYKAVQCDICDKWVHIACSNLKYIQKTPKRDLLTIVFVVFKRNYHIAKLTMMF